MAVPCTGSRGSQAAETDPVYFRRCSLFAGRTQRLGGGFSQSAALMRGGGGRQWESGRWGTRGGGHAGRQGSRVVYAGELKGLNPVNPQAGWPLQDVSVPVSVPMSAPRPRRQVASPIPRAVVKSGGAVCAHGCSRACVCSRTLRHGSVSCSRGGAGARQLTAPASSRS